VLPYGGPVARHDRLHRAQLDPLAAPGQRVACPRAPPELERGGCCGIRLADYV